MLVDFGIYETNPLRHSIVPIGAYSRDLFSFALWHEKGLALYSMYIYMLLTEIKSLIKL